MTAGTGILLKMIYRFGCSGEDFRVPFGELLKNITINGVSKQEFKIIIFYDDL